MRLVTEVVATALAGILVVCSDPNGPTIDASTILKYGVSFGFCSGYCSDSIIIKQDEYLFVRSGTNLPDSTMRLDDVDAVLQELNKVDLNKFLQLDSIIGAPDAADGGREFVYIRNNSIDKKVVFSRNTTVSVIEKLVDELRKLRSNQYEDIQGLASTLTENGHG